MKRIVVGMLCAAWIATIACRSSEPVSRTRINDDRILAMINSEPVFKSQFEKFIRFSGDPAENLITDNKTRIALFEEYVMHRLLLQEAGAEGIEIDRLEVEAYASEWAEDQPKSSAFYEHIQEFLTIQRLLHQKVTSNLDVSLPELRAYYQSHIDQFVATDQVHVLEILVPDRQQALEIRGQLKDGDIRAFRESARQHSSGVTADAGGDLGLFQEDELPGHFEDVIFALSPGEISDVFRSEKGHHLFLVEEHIPGHLKKFYEVQDEIFSVVMADKEREAVKNFLDNIAKSASIKVYDEKLNFIASLSEEKDL